MWTWITGIITIVCSVFLAVLLCKRKHISNKIVKVVKYICIALIPLVLGIGNTIADGKAGADKTGALAMIILLLAGITAFLGDIKRDV